MAAFGLVSGCDEDSNDGNNGGTQPSCDASMNTCVGSIAYFCGVNGTVNQMDCAQRNQICQNAVCVADPNACTSANNVCTDGKLSICSNGILQTTICASDEQCGTDAYGQPACVKQKVDPNPTCTSADNTCFGSKLKTCVDGRLILQTCPENESCNMVEGIAACVRNSDVACTDADNKCANGILSLCVDGQMQNTVCGKGFVCGVSLNRVPACVEKAPDPIPETEWIGNACHCEGEGCTVFGIPLPAPTNAATIYGCSNVDITDAEGGISVCLQTIPENQAETAPPTYFPAGYCAISAVGCEGSSLCSVVAYGDANSMTSCPAGSTLLASTFDYEILGTNATITNKTCVKSCETNEDCNVDGEISCIEKLGAKFCYNEKNFSFMGDNITVQVF